MAQSGLWGSQVAVKKNNRYFIAAATKVVQDWEWEFPIKITAFNSSRMDIHWKKYPFFKVVFQYFENTVDSW